MAAEAYGAWRVPARRQPHSQADAPQYLGPQAWPYPAQLPADALPPLRPVALRQRARRAAWPRSPAEEAALIPRSAAPAGAGEQSVAAREAGALESAGLGHPGWAGPEPANHGWAHLDQRERVRLQALPKQHRPAEYSGPPDETRLAARETRPPWRLPDALEWRASPPEAGPEGERGAAGLSPRLRLFSAELPSGRRPASIRATSQSSASARCQPSPPLPHRSSRYDESAGGPARLHPLPGSWSAFSSPSRRRSSGRQGSPCS
jgi:hypothetical protein